MILRLPKKTAAFIGPHLVQGRQIFQDWARVCFEFGIGLAMRTRSSPLPLWERSDRIDRCDPGEGLRTNDRPRPRPSPTRGEIIFPSIVFITLFQCLTERA